MATQDVSSGDNATETIASIAQAQTITAEEIALYDRQIRLWGVKAQEKLRTAHVLLITIKALSNEIAKNLVLAGIGAITLVDHEVVTGEDLGAQFLITEEDIGKNRAEAASKRLTKLNPRVNIHISTDPINQQPSSFFSDFSMIIATQLSLTTNIQVNHHARQHNIPFYSASTHGFYGYIFADLISHDYVIERESNGATHAGQVETPTRSVIQVNVKKDEKTSSSSKIIELVTKREKYVPLEIANKASLAPEIRKFKRRLRGVSPLISCFRALWSFQSQRGQQSPPSSSTSTNNTTATNGTNPPSVLIPEMIFPDVDSRSDIHLFTSLATTHHRNLELPNDTLTAQVIRRFLMNLGAELAPVTAFLGGQLAQDVINVLGQREQPVMNLLVFDGDTGMRADVFALWSDGKEEE
ncbi:MAG: hypothetical protein M1823_000423 [Watsoniomyces obsoletus]|nr:MAG: hypothetical protein M1823_000423 [Watsoniomyces obsoletus]